MDFCIGSPGNVESLPPDEDIHRVGPWSIYWCPSGNIELLPLSEKHKSKEANGLVVGTLLGALRQTEGLSTGNHETLGQAALASNGSFALVIFHESEITVVTDAAGSIPICYGDGPDGPAIGTRVHEVARAAGRRTLDRASAVDYLMHGSIVYPYTWFEDIRLFPPGSVCTISQDGLQVHRYWKPSEPDDIYDPCDHREWGQKLYQEVQSSIKEGLADTDRVRVFFSGGEDSRVIASLVPDDKECVLTTVLDSQNREYRLAKRAARALGRDFEWVSRPQGYYKQAVRKRIEAIGPGWDFRHTHFLGDIRETFRDTDALLGGYLADTFFKNYHMGNIEEGRGLTLDSLRTPDPDEIDVLKKGDSLSPLFSTDLVREVRERRNDHHRRLKRIRPMTAGNWHALWPISNAPHFPQYLGEHRIGPQVIEPFLFSRVYRLAAVMPDKCREDKRAFHHAFGKELGLAGWLPVSYGGVPRLRGYSGQIVAKAIGRFRILKQRINLPSGTQGPWTPNHYGWYPVVPSDHFKESAAERLRERLESMLAEDIAGEALNERHLSTEAAVRALALGFRS